MVNLEHEGRQKTLAVIIPAYNAQKYLEQSIYSVTKQPCKDLMVVIIDDGSTDKTYEIAYKLSISDERIHVIHKENGGVSTARNAGLDYCKNYSPKYIAFLDSDDVWVEGFYSNQLKNKVLSSGKDLYQFAYYDGNEELSRGRYHSVLEYQMEVPRFFPYFWCLMYKYEVIGELRFPKGIKVQEDEAFKYAYLCMCNSWEPINSPMYIYRMNSESISHQKEFDVEERYFKYVIPVWGWVERWLFERKLEKSTISEKDIQGCRTMQKTFLAEYIEVACRHGVVPARITEVIDKSNYKELFNHEEIWCDDRRKKIWSNFYQHPYLTFFKFRIAQIILSILQKFKDNLIVQKYRYPEKL